MAKGWKVLKIVKIGVGTFSLKVPEEEENMIYQFWNVF